MSFTLTTERLLLRPFQFGDEKAVLDFNGNEEVQRYTGDIITRTLAEAHSIIKDIWLVDYASYGYGRLAVIDKASDKLIGFAGLKYLPELDATDIGFRFLPQYWGKGLATEAAKPLLMYGLKTLELPEIIAMARIENTGSSRVLEKIGMKRYQTKPYLDESGQYHWYRATQDDLLK